MAFCLLTFNGQMSEKTGWVSGDDGFLALDKNNNGNIDDIYSSLKVWRDGDGGDDGGIMLHMVQRGGVMSCNEAICEFYSGKLGFN